MFSRSSIDGLGAQTNDGRVWRVRQKLPDFSTHKARPDTTTPQTHSLARVACSMPHRSLSKQHRSCLRQALAHTQLPHGTKTRARNSGSLLRRTAAMVPAHIQSSSPHLKMHCGCMRHVNRRTFPRSLPQHAGLYRTCSRASAPFGPLPQHWRLPRSAEERCAS